jgi:hypothetical protein
MSDEDEFEKIIRDIKDRLDKNEKLKIEVQNNVANIERIIGYEVEVSVIFDKGASDYDEIMKEYEPLEINDIDEKLKLGEFINFISEEDLNNNLVIDPLYLKGGLNLITNVLITTIDDCIVIVPKIKEKDE